ncbi:MAG: molybdate ABC transporter permease subunit, partial [Betaproteobacteria bacterium]
MRLSIVAVALSLVALLASEYLVRRARRRVRGHDAQR